MTPHFSIKIKRVWISIGIMGLGSILAEFAREIELLSIYLIVIVCSAVVMLKCYTKTYYLIASIVGVLFLTLVHFFQSLHLSNAYIFTAGTAAVIAFLSAVGFAINQRP